MQTLNLYRQRLDDLLTNHRQRILQAVIVAGVLFASAAAAYLVTSQSQLLLLLLPLPALVGVIVILQYPALGLILTFLGGVFIHFSGPSGLNVTMIGVAFLFAVWLAKMIIVDREIKFFQSKAIHPILVFFVLSLLSFGIGLLPFLPFARQAPLDAQVGGLAIFLLSAAAFLVAAHMLDLRWLEFFTWVFIVVGAAYMFGRLLSSQGVPIGRPFASGATTNSMFWVWLTAMAFGQAFLNGKLHAGIRLALLGVVILLSYVAYVLSNDWKSGWVPSFIVIAAIIGFRYWRPTLLLAPIALVGAGIAATLIIGTDEYSWGTRLDAWMIVVQMVAQSSPIFGLGFANYYWYSRYFPIRGYYIPFNSHSQYVDILAQTGIVGMICFIWIFWEALRLAWGLRERAPEGFGRAYTYSVMGGIVGTLVAASLVDWVLPFTYNIGFPGFRSSVLPWVFMGGLVCIEQLVRKQTVQQINKTPQGAYK